MVTNADITIYNREYVPESRTDIWHRTVIRNAWFHTENKVQQTDSGLKSNDICKIRIPEGSTKKEYLDPESYAASEDKDSYWTIQEDDIVVKGECPYEITKPADLKQLHKRYFKITSWSDNRFGGSPHWRIGGI